MLAPAVIAVVLVVGVIALASRVKGWQISDFEISGSDAFTAGEIQQALARILAGNYALIAPKSSFFLINSESVQKQLLAAYPKLRHVTVNKEFPNHLKISLSDRTLWGVVCKDPNVFGTQIVQNASSTEVSLIVPLPSPEATPAVLECFYIDDQGVAYERAPDITGTLILRIHMDTERSLLGTKVFDQHRIDRLQYILMTMEQATNDRIVGVEISSKVPSELRLKTGTGYQLYVNWDDDLQGVKKILERVMNEEIKDKRKKLEYVDLRFGNKVFYKMR